MKIIFYTLTAALFLLTTQQARADEELSCANDNECQQSRVDAFADAFEKAEAKKAARKAKQRQRAQDESKEGSLANEFRAEEF